VTVLDANDRLHTLKALFPDFCVAGETYEHRKI